MQLGFELHEASSFVLFQTLERHAGHLADDFRDDFFINSAHGFLALGAPFLLDFFLLLAKLFGAITQFGGLLVVGSTHRFVFFDAEALDVGLDISKVGRLGHGLEANTRAGFVNHVD